MATSVELRWDEERGAVFLTQRASWTPDGLGRFLHELLPMLDRSRARNGCALVLVDVSEIPAESTSFVTSVKGSVSSPFRDGDRFALVVSSSLVKSQLHRVGSDVLTYGFFLSRSAAETWLFAHHQALSA